MTRLTKAQRAEGLTSSDDPGGYDHRLGLLAHALKSDGDVCAALERFLQTGDHLPAGRAALEADHDA